MAHFSPSPPDATHAQAEPDRRTLDELGDAALFSRLMGGQARAINAVNAAEYQVTGAITASVRILENSGTRLIYCAAGTCARIALLDGGELKSAFNWPESRLAFLIAGGLASGADAVPGAETDTRAAEAGMRKLSISDRDVFVAVSASGTTPFTRRAMELASRAGALTVGFSNNPGTPILANANCPVYLDSGDEPVPGSTRLAAATSQKIALNVYSTALMVRLGKLYRGQPVDLDINSPDMELKAVGIVRDIVGCSEAAALMALEQGGFEIKRSVLIARGATRDQADELLERHGGRLAGAIAGLSV